ncbi:MAG: hypothetical protein NT002_00220 [candidate division Zixibacteria bacterium]|nr:hypothetical protein [candidate division Zixibacteria bacterium]
MQKRLRKKKKLDLNELSAIIANEATTPEPMPEPKPVDPTKNPAAVELGRLGGLKGGKARAKKMTKQERSEAARKAALARWKKLQK